jgi:hypothetical protein
MRTTSLYIMYINWSQVRVGLVFFVHRMRGAIMNDIIHGGTLAVEDEEDG